MQIGDDDVSRWIDKCEEGWRYADRWKELNNRTWRLVLIMAGCLFFTNAAWLIFFITILLEARVND